jgi:hypothetical protein
MMNPKTRHKLRRTLDTLEVREVPAFLSSDWAMYVAPAPAPTPRPVAAAVSAPVAPVAAAVSAPAPVMTAKAEYSPLVVSANGSQIVAYLQARLGQRVGGGECAHLAVEALRAAGARFAWLSGATTDYAWGAKLTGVVGTANGGLYRVPSARFQPGDVIQFTNARFRDGSRFPHHTAVVAAVDGNGRVTSVYQQNFGGNRTVTRNGLDLNQLIGGYVKVYRPLARVDLAGRSQFTIVNNTGAAVGVVERAGSAWASYTLGKANQANSYQIRTWTTYGGVKPTIRVAGQTIAVEHGAAYEVYHTGSGVSIRKIG